MKIYGIHESSTSIARTSFVIIDVTSYSDVQDYLPYRVPEIWLYKKQQLLIYRLQDENYQVQTHSLYFPELDLQSAIARCLEIADRCNTSSAICDLKQQLANR